MLNFYVLNSQHGFDLKQFLSGKLLAQSDVAVAQTLTNLGLNPWQGNSALPRRTSGGEAAERKLRDLRTFEYALRFVRHLRIIDVHVDH